MKVNRRRFLQGTAAAAAAGAFSSSAWAEDPIGVASVHDLSGGLDIYGKPMVDALTLAVEEANAAGGLLGRQIKLISYDTQSNMQLYTQFAQQAAIKDKVHPHDLHATILQCMGFDHTKLTYRFNGRDFRLTDVAGNVVKPLLA
jgi:hypothetical protein